MPTGKVDPFNSELGSRVIEPKDSAIHLSSHISILIKAGLSAPKIGPKLGYAVRQNPGELGHKSRADVAGAR